MQQTVRTRCSENSAMAAKTNGRTTSVDDDVCVVCFKDITIRCVMDCEHTICYECSTRLRVLCEKLECPICRQETTNAVFTREKGTFRSLYLRAMHNEDKYKLALDDESVRRAFAHLLAFDCPICEKKRSFSTFKQLSDHVLREHQLMYCDLCVKHLKIFNSERKLYSRERLALHRRKGDPDDSSHRGHPLCEYCDQRYMDKDELFLHLRRDHFFCHLCDADGQQIFYDDYAHLAEHFRQEHFLCEQGECQEKKFVVFRTNIDLQAHRASAHSENKSRGQQRLDRTLALEFSSEQPGRRRRNDRYGDGRSDRHDRYDRYGDVRSDRHDRREPGGAEQPPPPPPMAPPPQQVDTNSTQEFPTLDGGAAGSPELGGRGGSLAQRVAGAAGLTVRSTASRGRWDGRPVTDSEEEFPSLAGPAATAPPPPPAPAPSLSVNVQRRAPRTTNVTIDFKRRPASAGPAAAAAAAAAASADVPQQQPHIAQVSSSGNITIERRPPEPPRPAARGARPPAATEEAFPSLGRPATAVGRATWVQKRPEPPRPAPAKPTGPANGPTPDDFPSLGPVAPHGNFRSYSGTNSVKFAVNSAWATGGGGGDSSASASGGAGAGAKNKKKKKRPAASEAVAADARAEEAATAVTATATTAATVTATATAAATAAVNGLSLSGRPPPGFAERPAAAAGPAAQEGGEFQYQRPDSFSARNSRLVKMARDLCPSEDAFGRFRTLSKTYLENGLDGEQYYKGCMELMGNDKFGKLFPELLVLLPDISRQQELLAAHEKLNRNGFQRNRFPACPTCGQVLVFADFAQHTAQHCQDGDFPALS